MIPIELAAGFSFFVDEPYVPISSMSESIIVYKYPAPIIERAYLDDTGYFVWITFNIDVNYDEFDGTNCSSLFETNFNALDQTIYAKMTADPSSCGFEFPDPRTLQVFISADFAAANSLTVLGPGKKIKFRSGVLKAYNERFAHFFEGILNSQFLFPICSF
jgi:hypothetical protein